MLLNGQIYLSFHIVCYFLFDTYFIWIFSVANAKIQLLGWPLEHPENKLQLTTATSIFPAPRVTPLDHSRIFLTKICLNKMVDRFSNGNAKQSIKNSPDMKKQLIIELEFISFFSMFSASRVDFIGRASHGRSKGPWFDPWQQDQQE